MAKKNVGFFDQHIEKVAVGLCAAGMIAAAYLSFSGGRFSIDGRSPADLAKAVAESADQAKQTILSAKGSTTEAKGPDAGDLTGPIKDWFGENAKGLTQIARVVSPLPRAQPFPPGLPFTAESLRAEKRNLARLVTPSVPVVLTGRSTLNFPENRPLIGTGQEAEANLIRPNAANVSWVSVGAQVDLIEQQGNFISERYPPRSYFTIVKVHLQRKDESDPARGWQDVNTYLPARLPDKPLTPDGRIIANDVSKYKKAFDFDSDVVCRPTLPARVSGDRVDVLPLPYLDEPPKKPGDSGPVGAAPPESPEAELSRKAKKWTDWAKAALAGKKPFKQPDLDAATILAKSALGLAGAKEKEAQAAKQVFDEVVKQLPKAKKAWATATVRPPERLMPIVAHDLTPLPGHTYVYRMRYEVLNIYAGNTSDLINPEDALKLTLLSDWSPESRPVEIGSDIYFYLTKAEKNPDKAVVTVLKKSANGVTKKEFTLEPGEKIGKKEPTGQKIDYSTGAVCVDIDFDRVVDGKKEVAMVYSDPADGSLRERLLSKDSNDPVFKKLLEFKPPTKSRP